MFGFNGFKFGFSGGVSIPSAPTQIIVDATDDKAGKVVVSWTGAIGYPRPTFEVFRDSTSIGSPISSPFTDESGVIDTAYDYKVVATNREGFTEDTDSGVSTDIPANAWVDESSNMWTDETDEAWTA